LSGCLWWSVFRLWLTVCEWYEYYAGRREKGSCIFSQDAWFNITMKLWLKQNDNGFITGVKNKNFSKAGCDKCNYGKRDSFLLLEGQQKFSNSFFSESVIFKPTKKNKNNDANWAEHWKLKKTDFCCWKINKNLNFCCEVAKKHMEMWNFHCRNATKHSILKSGNVKARQMDFHFCFWSGSQTLNFWGARAKHGLWVSLLWLFKGQKIKISFCEAERRKHGNRMSKFFLQESRPQWICEKRMRFD
jgi:hypothetical protein